MSKTRKKLARVREIQVRWHFSLAFQPHLEFNPRPVDQQGFPLVDQANLPHVAEVHGSPTQNVPQSPYMYEKTSNTHAPQELASTGIYTPYPADPVELDSSAYGGDAYGGERASSSKPYTQVSAATPKNMIVEEEPNSDAQRIPLLQHQQIDDIVTPIDAHNAHHWDRSSPADRRASGATFDPTRASGSTFDQTRASRHSHFSEGPWSPARDAVEDGRLGVERR